MKKWRRYEDVRTLFSLVSVVMPVLAFGDIGDCPLSHSMAFAPALSNPGNRCGRLFVIFTCFILFARPVIERALKRMFQNRSLRPLAVRPQHGGKRGLSIWKKVPCSP